MQLSNYQCCICNRIREYPHEDGNAPDVVYGDCCCCGGDMVNIERGKESSNG
jgi:hypothetical protein